MAVKPTQRELQEQIKVIQWAKRQQQLPAGEGLPQDARDDLALLYSTLNGLFTHPQHAFNAKRAGLRAGVPDLVLPAPRGRWNGLYLELKAGRGSLSAEQKRYLEALAERGYRAEVARGHEEAIELLASYLAEERPRLAPGNRPGLG